MAAGRPSDYSIALIEEICFEVATSTRSLRTICQECEQFPDDRTVYKWLFKHDEFRQLYARAREYQIELIADEILDIVDDGQNDWMEKLGPDGQSKGYQVNGEAVQRSKLRADTRKWLLAKINPKKYGEATTIKGDAENPLIMHLAKALDERMARLPAPAAGPVVDAVARVVADAAAPAALPEDED